MKKIILFLILIFLSKISAADNKLLTIVQVNNQTITNLDVNDEIKIVKILYKDQISSENLYKIAINNLIIKIIKEEEIKKNNVTVNEKLINEKYQDILNQIKKNNSINNSIETKIYNKIKTDLEWVSLIKMKYSWRIDINMDEINEKIKDDKSNNLQKDKDKLIIIEKNKKIEMYAQSYLENLKKNSLIKYFK